MMLLNFLLLNFLTRPRCDIIHKRGKAQENVYFLKIVCIISLIRFYLYILQCSLSISLKQNNQLSTLLTKKKKQREELANKILELDKEMNKIERQLKRQDY